MRLHEFKANIRKYSSDMHDDLDIVIDNGDDEPFEIEKIEMKKLTHEEGPGLKVHFVVIAIIPKDEREINALRVENGRERKKNGKFRIMGFSGMQEICEIQAKDENDALKKFDEIRMENPDIMPCPLFGDKFYYFISEEA